MFIIVPKFFQNLYGQAYDFAPLTFILPNEYSKFIDASCGGNIAGQTQSSFYNHSPLVKFGNNNRNTNSSTSQQLWICKPTDLSRGRGIYLLSGGEQLQKLDHKQIVQQYISNPYLIGGYKWDLRVYALVTKVYPLKIYIFEEGLVRFST